MDSISPERMYISYPYITENIKKHFIRYEFASQFTSGVCLDCACGSGYGSNILSNKSVEVFSIDKSQEAIDYAKEHNQKGNIIYTQNNINDFDFAENYFNTIVSLETIEHISKDTVVLFFNKVKKILKYGGVFICSTPMLRMKEGEPYITSPYHINEMLKSEFLTLVDDSFPKYTKHFYHQQDSYFVPLGIEQNGFCIVVIRKNE